MARDPEKVIPDTQFNTGTGRTHLAGKNEFPQLGVVYPAKPEKNTGS
jgi:hypothetical protein